MYSDLNEPIWSVLVLMIDSAELAFLIVVCVTSTLIQGHRDENIETCVPII